MPSVLPEQYEAVVQTTFESVKKNGQIYWRTSLGMVKINGIHVGGGNLPQEGSCEVKAGNIVYVQAGEIKIEYGGA